jgi:Flp pilus assembly protein TadD
LTKARADLGSVLGRMGRYEEAAQQFEEILKKDPGNAEARRNLAFARKRLVEK